MDKKALQRKRMKRYFIDAAKDIIKTRGLSAVSVRNVADAAGYSYATIYNYFSDLNDLLWHVALDFIEEMASILGQVYKVGKDPVVLLKAGYRAYVGYYLENPAIFHFLFHSELGDPSQEVASRLKLPLIGEKQQLVLRDCVARGIIAADDLPKIAEILVDIVHGLLLMYFGKKGQLTEEELFNRLESDIDFIVQRSSIPGKTADQ